MNIGNLLRNSIQRTGHITIADAMADIISHPDYGYYANNQSIGSKGDFITSPEISQLFGELIGAWCADIWCQMGKPAKINLVELGPGKGTLMCDLLNVIRKMPDFYAAASVHLVEISPILTEIQQRTLSEYRLIEWHKNFSSVSKAPLIVIANEFFDCLPIHQYLRIKENWLEKAIFLSQKEELFISELPIKKSLLSDLDKEYHAVSIGSIVELSPTSSHIAGQLATQIVNYGGAVLAIDYGYDYPPNMRPNYISTLQAVKNHAFHPILTDLGSADLTAHVDFHSLRKAAELRNLQVLGTTTQGEFLTKLGIETRLEMLLANANAKQKLDLVTGARRLTAPYQMGELFKVLCFADQSLSRVVGF